ncbi:MAG: lytC3 [Acidobacteriales bacterium]|nr:lytC3 [Terriglobales bacterium]
MSFGTKAGCEIRRRVVGNSTNPHECAVAAARVEYAAMGFTYKDGIQEYTTYGDWLNCGKAVCSWQGDRFHFDKDGIPIVNYGGSYYYNPVTTAMYGLAMYGRSIHGDRSSEAGLNAATEKLISLQDSRGAFLYNFPYQTYRPGWVSGMGQGLALSLLARAYYRTGNVAYLEAGDKAFDFLITPTSKGGTLENLSSLPGGKSDEIVFEEYPTSPPEYTLNGFMFAMLGVYDWTQVPGRNSAMAGQYFQQALHSLKVILPDYDLGGFTAYDLEHVVSHRKPWIGVNYHATHIYLLHALGSVTHDSTLRHYEQLWASYVPQ